MAQPIDLVDGESGWCPLLPSQVTWLQGLLGLEVSVDG